MRRDFGQSGRIRPRQAIGQMAYDPDPENDAGPGRTLQARLVLSHGLSFRARRG